MMKLNLNTMDLTELLKHEDGYILYEGSEGSIVREGRKGTVIFDITDADRFFALFEQLHLSDSDLVVTKSMEIADRLKLGYGFTGRNPCTQWVYTAQEPPKYSECDIRPLTEAYAQIAGAQYHENFEYVQNRIAAQRMWGLFEDGKLAGFIGIHSEGAMGMLEVFPEYRKKGYGYTLEAYLIDLHLRRGWVPFCHVIDGNEASIHLQKKLGLECAPLPVIWNWQEGEE